MRGSETFRTEEPSFSIAAFRNGREEAQKFPSREEAEPRLELLSGLE